MARAILALGSNLGDREGFLAFAVSSLSQLPGTHVIAESRHRETDPVDVPKGYEELKFLNAAVLIETALTPEALLTHALAIERNAGRVRTIRNGPRPLDVDVIMYEGETRNTTDLTLPHPRAHERNFVLEPLQDLGFTRDDILKNRFQ